MPPSPAPVLERYSRKPVAVTKRLRRLSMACPANRLFASFNNTSRPPISDEHTSELLSLLRFSYSFFFLIFFIFFFFFSSFFFLFFFFFFFFFFSFFFFFF